MTRTTRGKANHVIVHAARENRRQLTPAERRLWNAIRDRQLAGLRFRIQHPFERFVLDFFCVEHMLCLEVDGGIHNTADQQLIDQERTLRLNEIGVRVMRFRNEEIFKDLPSVLGRIVEKTREPYLTPGKK